MAEAPTHRLALAHVTPYRGNGLAMDPAPERNRLLLRGQPDDAFLGVVVGIAGIAPPVAPNTAAISDAVTILWLGPDEWLVETAALPLGPFTAALAGSHAAVLDVSDAYTVIRLVGVRTPDVLSSGCSLDLHPRAFPGVARTLLGKADVLLHRIGHAAEPTFDVYVARSYADYLWRWLAVAASG